jgi:hypothetical protein
MKKIVLVLLMVIASSAMAHADFGSMLNAVKSSPLMTQQASLNDVLGKLKSISTTFSQMPANSGKLDFIKAALPLLTKANTVAETKPGDVTQVGGLLDKVKGLIAQKWNPAPLTPAQAPQVAQQSEQFSGLLSSVLKKVGGALKNLIPASIKH